VSSKKLQRWGVYLTKEAHAEFADHFINDYVQYGKFLDCISFNSAPQYLSVVAVLEREGQHLEHEFLIPHRYVAYVVSNPDHTVPGFESTQQAVRKNREIPSRS
jgi:hypothetical protein